MATEHLIQINRGATRLLVAMLAHPGWYTDTASAARACAMLELPELDQNPGDRKDESPEFKVWADEPVEFKLPERQRDAAKACIEAHSKVGRFFLSKYHGLLLRVFGLEPKDG